MSTYLRSVGSVRPLGDFSSVGRLFGPLCVFSNFFPGCPLNPPMKNSNRNASRRRAWPTRKPKKPWVPRGEWLWKSKPHLRLRFTAGRRPFGVPNADATRPDQIGGGGGLFRYFGRHQARAQPPLPVSRKPQGFRGFRADHALRLLAFLFENHIVDFPFCSLRPWMSVESADKNIERKREETKTMVYSKSLFGNFFPIALSASASVSARDDGVAYRFDQKWALFRGPLLGALASSLSPFCWENISNGHRQTRSGPSPATTQEAPSNPIGPRTLAVRHYTHTQSHGLLILLIKA